jgi:hypothetical protein
MAGIVDTEGIEPHDLLVCSWWGEQSGATALPLADCKLKISCRVQESCELRENFVPHLFHGGGYPNSHCAFLYTLQSMYGMHQILAQSSNQDSVSAFSTPCLRMIRTCNSDVHAEQAPPFIFQTILHSNLKSFPHPASEVVK